MRVIVSPEEGQSIDGILEINGRYEYTRAGLTAGKKYTFSFEAYFYVPEYSVPVTVSFYTSKISNYTFSYSSVPNTILFTNSQL